MWTGATESLRGLRLEASIYAALEALTGDLLPRE